MTDFTGADLRGARFDRADLTGAQFRACLLRDAAFKGADLTRVVMRGAELRDVDISGELSNVTINGVAIAPLIEAELNRRYPQRAKMRPAAPAGFREAWAVLRDLWAQTEARAARLPPDLLHESVGGEWSFIETLRHLVFATDAWVRRAILGNPSPWSPLGLPWDEMSDVPEVPRDRAARPSLGETLDLRRGRVATVTGVIDGLTPQILASGTAPVDAPGWPRPASYPVRECLLNVLNEEWEHRLYAERDLAVLELRPGRPGEGGQRVAP